MGELEKAARASMAWLEWASSYLPFPLWYLIVGTIVVGWLGYLLKCRYGGKS